MTHSVPSPQSVETIPAWCKALLFVLLIGLVIGKKWTKKRDKSALFGCEHAEPFFYLCDLGTDGSIKNETGYSANIVGLVWALTKEYCALHPQKIDGSINALPPPHIFYMALKQNHRYHKKRDTSLLSCYKVETVFLCHFLVSALFSVIFF